MGELRHEEIVIATGRRSKLPIIVAVHSTALGQAGGGCRMWHYSTWREGVEDALRLSEAMTMKFALAALPFGGGKSVIALPPGSTLAPDERREVMLDLGDVVESLDGRFGVAEDVGTTAEDMLVVSERTAHAYCLPTGSGGVGDPSEATANGVDAAIRTTCEWIFGDPSAAGRRFTIVGLGQVGSKLALRLMTAGASLVVTDIDETKRQLAEALGATWIDPVNALHEPADVLVPAALGGILTPDTVKSLECRAIVGPANNQLASDDVAELIAKRGILWAPDFLVNAGGAIFGALADADGLDPSDAMERVNAIGSTLRTVLELADKNAVTPYTAAAELARARVADAIPQS